MVALESLEVYSNFVWSEGGQESVLQCFGLQGFSDSGTWAYGLSAIQECLTSLGLRV